MIRDGLPQGILNWPNGMPHLVKGMAGLFAYLIDGTPCLLERPLD
jgi:hypothetical protein